MAYLRTIIFQWFCAGCEMVKEDKFTVYPAEAYPIPDDPPIGWMKYVTDSGHTIYRCPGCMSKIKEKM